MQNIDLICIGKMNAKYFAEGVAEYQKRHHHNIINQQIKLQKTIPHIYNKVLYAP